MSRYAVRVGVIVFALAAVQAARAGLYNTADAPEETRLSLDFVRVFSGTLGDLRSIGAEKPERESTLRKRYLLMETLGNKGGLDLRSLEQQLNYSVVLIRRNRADDAIEILEPLRKEYPKNIIVNSHFATAHAFSKNADLRVRAADLMKETLDLWPKNWEDVDAAQKRNLERIGWSQPVFDWYRKCEDYYRRLLKHRNLQEARRKNKLPVPDIYLDPIFVDAELAPVKFVTEAGVFEAGRIPAAEKQKLPGDAVDVVEQLLVWNPNDMNLYWLLGEVYNASAMGKKKDEEHYRDIKAAHLILRELVNGLRKEAPAEMAEHHEILKKYIETTKEPNPLSDRDFKLPPNIIDDPPPPELPWRHMVVAFITGLAIGLFALWQVQEMRRRRQARGSP